MMHVTHKLPGSRRRDSAGVIAPPPVLYGAALIGGLLLHARYPFDIAPSSSWVLEALGIVLIALGLALNIAVMRVFRMAGTPVTPRRATAHLVVTGPYRHTRNPDYIGQTLTYVGIAIVVNSWWPIVLLPVVLVIVDRSVTTATKGPHLVCPLAPRLEVRYGCQRPTEEAPRAEGAEAARTRPPGPPHALRR